MLIWRYAARRITQLIPILFGITVVSFVLIRIVPGDPATQILGNHYTPAAAAAINRDLGLDRSLPAQYWLFLKSVFTGDFGHSYFYNASVGDLVSARWLPTLYLILAAGILTALIAIPLR